MNDFSDEVELENENGEKITKHVLFTYDNEERKCSYIFLYEDGHEDDIEVFRVNSEGDFEEITDDDEYNEVEEVFNCFIEDPKIKEIK